MDVDRHVMEPLEMWREYLPADMQEHAPRLGPLYTVGETPAERLKRLGEHALLPTPHILSVDGKPLMRNVSEAAYIETGLIAERRRALLTAAESPDGQLAHMDASGVDVAVMLPTFAPFLVYDDEIPANRSRAYARAYNRWLGDFCSTEPTRLIGAALLSRHDPEAMVGDVEQALRDGLPAVVMRPNPVCGLMLGSAPYSSFWAACAQNSVTVLLHEGTHTRVSTAGADRFESHFAQHACSHPMEMMMAMLSLVEGGVLERFPALRVAFLESGCGWLPYWLWRLDHMEYAQLHAEVRGRVARPPSEYFRRQCWIAAEPSESMLPEFVRNIDASRVVFGTDFPHLDHGPGIVDEMISQKDELGEELLSTILWSSGRQLMGMPLVAGVRNVVPARAMEPASSLSSIPRLVRSQA
jgi:predicted TIM-barrel fold metal-dependent hydrolase